MHKTRMEPTELFFKYYKILFHTETITNLETGEVFKLSSTDIHLYCYFIDQFKSYTKRQLQFFESSKSIESKTPHASDKSIRDFIKKFSELGLIKYQKIKKGGKFHSNLYTLVLTPDEAKGIVSFNTIWSSQEETSPQEPQQPETNAALPSSDDIHTSADSLSDDVPMPTGKVNLIFTPYNPEEEEDENYGEDEEEDEELEDWERVDESPPSQIKPSSISLAMRNQLYPQRKSEKGYYTEHIPF
ncbi:DUF6945 domain-containing protein [Pantoea dispersa]|uniref:DUF6945 domain-containing protein n=1 Tax=Pantoea dispersa TaxID=59814 RepID=UPI003989C0F9